MKLTELLEIFKDNPSQTLGEIESLFSKDQYSTISELEDILIQNQDTSEHTLQTSAVILFSLLAKHCKDDKYRIESTYNKLLKHYTQQKNDNHQLVELISLLLIYFNQHTSIDGEWALKSLLSNDVQKINRVLQLLVNALRPLQNQLETDEVIPAQQNVIQKQCAQIIEIHSLLDGLYKFADQDVSSKVGQKDKNQSEMKETATQDLLSGLATNCLFQLRNHIPQSGQKKLIVLLTRQLNSIEAICNGDNDLITEYLYFLFKNHPEFIKGKENSIFDKVSNTISQYFNQVILSDGCYSFKEVQKSKLIQRIEETEGFSIISHNIEYLIKEKLNQKNPSRFTVCKYTAVEMIKTVVYSYPSKKYFNSLFNLTIHLAAIPFTTFTENKQIPTYDYDIQQQMVSILETLCENPQVKPQFIDYLFKTMIQIDKRSEIDNQQEQHVELTKNKGSTFKNLSKEIKVVQKEDRFILIGCYQILEQLINVTQEEIKGNQVKFIPFFSYQLFDEYLFHYCIAFISTMASCIGEYMLPFHQMFIPQLIKLLEVADEDFIKFQVSECLSSIFTNFPKVKVKEFSPYLKQVLSICVKQYMAKGLFLNQKINSYYQIIQLLINTILSFEKIELYLRDDIISCEKIFLEMIQDKNKRDLLITNNHQVCLLGLLKVQQRIEKRPTPLQKEVVQVSHELAQKIYKNGAQMTPNDKSLIYSYLSYITVDAFQSQEIVDQIFLLVLPTVLVDIKTPINYRLELNGNQDGAGVGSVLHHLPQGVAEQEQYDEWEDEQSEGQEGEEVDDDDEEEEDEQQEELVGKDIYFSTPNVQKIDLVCYSMKILATFSEQCFDLFFSHKKFEILNELFRLQTNNLLDQDAILQCHKTLARIILSFQNNLTKSEKLQKSDLKDEEQYTENSKLELQPLIDLFLLRLGPTDSISGYDQVDSGKETMVIINQAKERIIFEVQNFIYDINSKTANTFFDQIFTSLERQLFSAAENKNEAIIDVCQISINKLLRLAPSKIVQSLLSTWRIIETILTDDQDYLGGTKLIQGYEQYKRLYKTERNLKKKVLRLSSGIGPFIVIQCITELQSQLKVKPEVFEIINPLFNSIILYENFSEYEQYLQYVCRYVRRIIFYCQSYFSQDVLLQYHPIFEKLVLKIDETFYGEISPVESLRMTFSMLTLYLYPKFTPQQQLKQHKYLALFLDLFPLKEKFQEYRFVLSILENLLSKINYELNPVQRKNILKQIILAIDNPKQFCCEDQKDIERSFKLIQILNNKYQQIEKEIINIIEQEDLMTPKDVLLYNLQQYL